MAAIPPRSPDIASGGQEILLISSPPKDHKAPARTNNIIALFFFKFLFFK